MNSVFIFSGVPIDDSATFFRAGFVAKKLIEKGNRIFFASVSNSFKKEEEKNINGLDVFFIGQAHYKAKKNFSERERLGFKTVLFENIKTCFRLYKILKKTKPSVVLVVTSMPVSLMAGILSKILGIKVFIDIEDFALGQMEASGYPPFLVKLNKIIESIALRTFDKIIVPSNFLKEKYKRSILLPNMVDVSFWKRKRKRKDSLKRIVFVGQMGNYHGQMKILNSFAELIRNNKNLRLIFIGGGEKISNIKFQISNFKLQDQVEVTGYVPQEKVRSILATCDIGVLPLWNSEVHKARHSLKLLEYLAAGLIVVSNKVGEAEKMIRHGENGILCPAGDMECLAKSAVKALRDPVLADKIKKKAELSAKEFSLEKILPLWQEVLVS